MKDWCLEVSGDYACFTRPEMKVERVSYDVITPSAARAIVEAILWKPAIRWHVTGIEVLNPIRWVSVRRNEVGKIFSSPTADMLKGVSGKPFGVYVEDERQQRAGLFLRDVKYRLHVWFEFIPPDERKTNRSSTPEFWADAEEAQQFSPLRPDEKEAKYAAMFDRRSRKGQCFHRPYLGCREFACNFRPVDPTEEPASPIDETRDLGWMLYDLDFQNPADPRPLFFRASLQHGVLQTDRRQVEVRG
jgi:CRISPR-associated protein Cas5d